ncbi:hypothetical protein O6H91_01G058000 [Diphasiastrum complanatum]|uniref:Uncharacterized protein n=1 Tax=Diphasiastrum complanatum TaxID=34168 RepID=A0ACC2ERK1_DIPCM|nr:hypothetical protein O6H91_01G058000 [Diphasiastrum complanatum]
MNNKNIENMCAFYPIAISSNHNTKYKFTSLSLMSFHLGSISTSPPQPHSFVYRAPRCTFTHPYVATKRPLFHYYTTFHMIAHWSHKRTFSPPHFISLLPYPFHQNLIDVLPYPLVLFSFLGLMMSVAPYTSVLPMHVYMTKGTFGRAFIPHAPPPLLDDLHILTTYATSLIQT